MDDNEAIYSLRKEEDAIILAHNYQRSEVQDIADFIGDSLELSIRASEVGQSTILFCGVTFMAETAKILSPKKRVLMPRRDVRCPMADMVTAEDIVQVREEHPSAAVVSYVNTNAEVKAESDVCCTSANAVRIIESVDADEIIFVPDMHLAHYVSTQTEKIIIPWKGFCYVHSRMLATETLAAKEAHPNAVLLVHPESPAEVINLADEVLSTGGMVRCAKESKAREFLIATEEGLLYRLKNENPGKRFMPAGTPRVCTSMKKTTLHDVREALAQERYEVAMDEDTRVKAERALRKMIELS